MSPSAQRLSSDVRTGPFLFPLTKSLTDGTASFDPVVRSLETPAGSSGFAETREITLPSAAAERARAIEREAFARGIAEGERTGEDAALAKLLPIIERLNHTIDDVAALRGRLLRHTEHSVVKLALAMAERIVHREVQQDRELLLAMARIAVDQLGDRVVATIHLHPRDVETLMAGREQPPGSVLTIAADASLPRGGCRVESVFGVIDVGVDAQIQELTRSLLGDERHTDGSSTGERG
jgi:flagellar assembly protein FliH